MEFYLAINKNETDVTGKWLEVEIVLNEKGYIKKVKYFMFSLICKIKN